VIQIGGEAFLHLLRRQHRSGHSDSARGQQGRIIGGDGRGGKPRLAVQTIAATATIAWNHRTAKRHPRLPVRFYTL
jgi:hypothetical protein